MKRRIFNFLLLLLLPGSAALAQPNDPAQSIYQLNVHLVSQSGNKHGLNVYQGHPVLITMFYGNCPHVCPLLVETLQMVERKLDASERANLRVLMISIDPQRDSPAALAAFARTRKIDLSRWTLAHADEITVRKIAAVLNIQYRRLPDGDYNHASVISLLTAKGAIARQSSVLGKADSELVAALATGSANRPVSR